ncbi:hypothetical protein PT974_03297 [Cladobotryum mycophilum]|uniref:Uncharacterized protein n=1 Tax=Cladobotryum mycophilum TaxID=491253 RepID=A0ABR0SS82_9HYPO
MPPRRLYGEKPRRAPKGFFVSTYETLTSSDNAAVVRSIALFGAAVTLLSSSWGEFLLPPYAHIFNSSPFHRILFWTETNFDPPPTQAINDDIMAGTTARA